MSCWRRIRVSFAIVQHPGDGEPGQSASHAGENLIMASPSDKEDLLALLLMHVGHGAGCAMLQPSPWGARPMDCSGRSLRSCEVEPPVEVAKVAA
jgi:hypothetical protein